MKAIRFQKYIAVFSVLLFLAKILAWYLTNSVMVLTDALEGIVNMVTGFLGLYSLILSAKPRDKNHPYGHGKIQYLTSAVEGTLIIVSAFVIIYEATEQLIIYHELQKLDIGLIIVVSAGLVNYALGKFAEISGRRNNSIVLESAGKHLITDGYSSIAIIIGLGLLVIVQSIPSTHDKYLWLDSAVALCFALIILITGYKVLRRSISGIMDEVDTALLNSVVEMLQKSRQPQWVDLHNLRVIQYGDMLHVDAHISLPWYYNVQKSDKEIHALEGLIKSHFGDKVELFIHTDACVSSQCGLCALSDCPERKNKFSSQLTWEIGNVWTNEMHGVNVDI